MKRKIFSVLGILPEPGGYAAAKFSRTPVIKSYQDWALELTEEGAQRFYNSFYQKGIARSCLWLNKPIGS